MNSGEAEQLLREQLTQTRSTMERQKLLKALWKLSQESEGEVDEPQKRRKAEAQRPATPAGIASAV